MNNFLFSVNEQSEEVSVSESPKGSNKINLIEKIKRSDNEVFYQAVLTLTILAKDPNMDDKIFKAMDKVCQMLYSKHKGC